MIDTNSDFRTAMAARRLSKNFTAADLCCAGETWQRTQIWNEPLQDASWSALKFLCNEILEPVAARFGIPDITYGFASAALFRLIPFGTTKKLDQHASCELGRSGTPLCPRLGAAVDFYVPSVSSRQVAIFIADNLPFDRMYYYADNRPIHVSIGPQNNKALVEMQTLTSGHLIPRVRKLSWLTE